LGIPFNIVIQSRITHASSSSQEALLRKTAARGSREERERSQSVPLTLPASYSLFLQMCADRFHIVSLFLHNPCTPSTLCKEAFVYFVCPTEIPQPPFAWKYYFSQCILTPSIIQHTISLRVCMSHIYALIKACFDACACACCICASVQVCE